MNRCRLLKSESVSVLADLGPQPISNRFLSSPHAEELVHPMIVGQCQTSGLVQLCNPVPAAELAPQFDWITYNEPEDHLDDMVDVICRLPGITKASKLCGLTFKDGSTLKRLEKRGYTATWSVDPGNDLDIHRAGAGAETIQDRFTIPRAQQTVANHGGQVDMAIVRHILEHAYDTCAFIQAVKELVRPGGYVVFEVPDCTRALDCLDYSTLWEEHVLYFTEETFRHCFAAAGLSLIFSTSYPYVFENSLVGIARVEKGIEPTFPDSQALQQEKDRANTFFVQLPDKTQKVNEYLSNYRKSVGKIALFGAGHLACTYINILKIKSHIEFVIDDNPHKTNLYMPGSGLPIKPSKSLLDENIRLCLLSLNPLSEDKVITNNHRFTEQGGTFASIFPASKRVFYPTVG